MPDEPSQYIPPWRLPPEASEIQEPEAVQQPPQRRQLPQAPSPKAGSPGIPGSQSKPRIRIAFVLALAIAGIIASSIGLLIGLFFNYFIVGGLTRFVPDYAVQPVINSGGLLIVLAVIYISFSPLILYVSSFHKTLLKVYAIIGVLVLVTPVVVFFTQMANYNKLPSKIERPSKFLVQNSNFYIYDKGEYMRGDIQMGVYRGTSKPPLIWVYDLKTEKLNERLRLQDERAVSPENSLISPKKFSGGFEHCLSEDILVKKSNNEVETYKRYEKNKEILVYPSNKVGFKSRLSRPKGFTNIIKLEYEPVGLFKFQDNVYVITRDTNQQIIKLIKISTSSKEQITLATNNIDKGYFRCNRDNQILQIISYTKFIAYYDLKAEKYIFNVKLNNKYATNYYDIGENVLVYGADGLKIVNKKENRIIKEYEGLFYHLFDYNENYIIWYKDSGTLSSLRDDIYNVYLLDKNNLQLLKFSGI